MSDEKRAQKERLTSLLENIADIGLTQDEIRNLFIRLYERKGGKSEMVGKPVSSGINEQPGLYVYDSGALLELDLNGYTNMCLLELPGARYFRERLDAAITKMEEKQ